MVVFEDRCTYLISLGSAVLNEDGEAVVSKKYETAYKWTRTAGCCSV